MKNNISSGFQILQDLIKLRWVPEITKSIDEGNHRYTDIKNSIHEISHTELNRKLSILVEKGVIHKKDNTDNDAYNLLKFGEDLLHIFYHLEDLQEKYCQRY